MSDSDFTMMTLNCTKKLARRLPFPLTENPQPCTNALGAWCANSFNVGRIPLIILTNEKTLLSVVIHFKEARTFYTRFLDSLEVLFHSPALSSAQMSRELNEMKVVELTNRTNRSVPGSMTDFVYNVQASEPGRSPEEMSFYLSEFPCLPLKYRSPATAVPDVIDPHPTIR